MANFPSRGSAWVLISGGFFLFFSVCDASGGRCGVVILCTGQRSSEDVSVPSLLMYRADQCSSLPLYRIVGLKEPPIPLDIHRHPAFEPRKARASNAPTACSSLHLCLPWASILHGPRLTTLKLAKPNSRPAITADVRREINRPVKCSPQFGRECKLDGRRIRVRRTADRVSEGARPPGAAGSACDIPVDTQSSTSRGNIESYRWERSHSLDDSSAPNRKHRSDRARPLANYESAGSLLLLRERI